MQNELAFADTWMWQFQIGPGASLLTVREQVQVNHARSPPLARGLPTHTQLNAAKCRMQGGWVKFGQDSGHGIAEIRLIRRAQGSRSIQ
jgi:hypothetical protein